MPIVAVLTLGIVRRWTSTFGFVYFRTVDQILAGNGPVFNDGERVETFMSPVWTAALVVVDAVTPLRLEVAAAILSLGCVVASMVIATLAAMRIARVDDVMSMVVPLGAAVFAALWPVWIWSTGGTEVGLCYLWIAACLYAMVRCAHGDRTEQYPLQVPTATLMLAGLGWVIRPELLPSSVLFVGVLVAMSTTSKRQRWRMVAIAFAIPILYQLFRMTYFGLVVPNPVIARDGLSPRPRAGWDYLVNFVGPYGLVVPVVAIIVGIAAPTVRRLWGAGRRRLAIIAMSVSLSGFVHAAFLVLVGGDHVHARLLLPALFAVLAPFFVTTLNRRATEAVVVIAIWLPISALLLRTDGLSAAVFGTTYSPGALTYQDTGFQHRGGDQRGWDGPGLYTFDPLSRTLTPTAVALADGGTAIAADPAGVIGYVAGVDVDIIDLGGAADPITAHQRADIDWFVGLEKFGRAPWIIADRAEHPAGVEPDRFLAGSGFGPDPRGLAALEARAWAEATLECGQLAERRESYKATLTPSRIVANLWNALPNTELRLDSNPHDAYVELCGLRTPGAVEAFLDRVAVTDRLPENADPGDVVVVDGCALAFFGATNGSWLPIEGSNFMATIALDAAAVDARRFPLYTHGPYDDDGADTEITVETNGAGEYRIRSDTDWFPSVVQPWMAIPDEAVVVTFTPDLIANEWSVIAGQDELVRLPIALDGDVVVPTPAVDEGSSVAFTQVGATPTCEGLLPHTLGGQ
jgi:arabinofuranosyltransferase